ncbi:MAG: hypothetical protein LUE27_06565 [Clostridia bacterium]|nr:hypothetical protein [Clostridia bacterium]
MTRFLPGSFRLSCMGDDIPDAYETAQDALSLRLYDAEAPEPSSRMEDIHAEEEDEIIMVEGGDSGNIIVSGGA